MKKKHCHCHRLYKCKGKPRCVSEQEHFGCFEYLSSNKSINVSTSTRTNIHHISKICVHIYIYIHTYIQSLKKSNNIIIYIYTYIHSSMGSTFFDTVSSSQTAVAELAPSEVPTSHHLMDSFGPRLSGTNQGSLGE